MGLLAKIFIAICGVSFFCIILYFLIRKKINEKTSLLWLAGALGILAISAMPDLLDAMAKLLGIKYPPALLFLLSTLILLLVSLSQSIEISSLQEKVRELTQIIAINKSKEEDSKK